MTEPTATRPHMPGYGVEPATGTADLLAWSWATDRLVASHAYWVATVWPDGRPHVMPVWGAWFDGALWFSSGLRSRKARNLLAEPRCTITTDEPSTPVIVEGLAARTTDLERIAAFAHTIDAKYGTDYGPDFYDPADNACFAVRPTSVFAVDEERFTTSPTRWHFA